jgi:L-threonine kinase
VPRCQSLRQNDRVVGLNKLPSGVHGIAGPFRDRAATGLPVPTVAVPDPAPRVVASGGRSRGAWSVAVGTALGTCGELLQGFTSAGTPFHVTCPIQKSATVTLRVRPADEFTVSRLPAGHAKLQQSLHETAKLIGLDPVEVRVEQRSDLDVGKGMGSSTADIVAAARALATIGGRELSPDELARIATSIESSDGSMHPGMVAFNQKSGDVVRRYRWWPRFVICMIVPVQGLDTESARFSGKEVHGPEFDDLLDRLDRASEERDAAAFAEVATRSAELNQQFVPNPVYSLVADRVGEVGADGVNLGHSGTVVGLLFDASKPTANRLAAAAAVSLERMVPSGARVEVTVSGSISNA